MGSGIMGKRPAEGNIAVALLANSLATGAGLSGGCIEVDPVVWEGHECIRAKCRKKRRHAYAGCLCVQRCRRKTTLADAALVMSHLALVRTAGQPFTTVIRADLGLESPPSCCSRLTRVSGQSALPG